MKTGGGVYGSPLRGSILQLHWAQLDCCIASKCHPERLPRAFPSASLPSFIVMIRLNA